MSAKTKTLTKKQREANAKANNNALLRKQASKVTHLKEGVTGKQLMKAQSNSNNAHKKDMFSFKTALKRAKDFDKKFITSMHLTRQDLTERKLKALMNDKEIERKAIQKEKFGYEKYSVWFVQSLIKRLAKAKAKEQKDGILSKLS